MYRFVISMTISSSIFRLRCNTGCLCYNVGWSDVSWVQKKCGQAMQWRNINGSNNSVHANASKTHRHCISRCARCIRSLAGAVRLCKLTDPPFSLCIRYFDGYATLGEIHFASCCIKSTSLDKSLDAVYREK